LKIAAFKLNGLHTEDSSSVTRIREVGLGIAPTNQRGAEADLDGGGTAAGWRR